MARGQPRLGDRQDHSPLDRLLGLLEPAQFLPQAWADDPAAQARDRVRGLRDRRELALHVHQRRVGLVAAALESRRDTRDPAGTALGELGFEGVQQLVGDVGTATRWIQAVGAEPVPIAIPMRRASASAKTVTACSDPISSTASSTLSPSSPRRDIARRIPELQHRAQVLLRERTHDRSHRSISARRAMPSRPRGRDRAFDGRPMTARSRARQSGSSAAGGGVMATVDLLRRTGGEPAHGPGLGG